MKEIIIPFSEIWQRHDYRAIMDPETPIGALVWGVKCDQGRVDVYTYNSNAGALRECGERSMLINAGQPMGFKYAGYDAFGISRVLGDSVIQTFIFFEVEDFVVELIFEGLSDFVPMVVEWVENNLEVGEEVPNNNGNPMRGGMPLVPPAMLFQMVDFTQRDYEVSKSVSPNLPSHFDFIVKASLAPAATADELIERVNEDYSRHFGFREIDYDRLSEDAQALLEQADDYYIGLAGTHCYPVRDRVILAIDGFSEDDDDEPFLEETQNECAYDDISDILVEYLTPEEEE